MQTFEVRRPLLPTRGPTQPISLQDLAQAVEHSEEGFALTDGDGNYVYINHAHLRMYGYERPEELLGHSWRRLYTQDWVRHFEEAVLPIIPRDKVWRGQVIGRRRDGSSFLAGVTLTLLPDGKITCNCRDESVHRAPPDAHVGQPRTALRELGERLIAGLPGRLRRPLEMLHGYTGLLLGEVADGRTPTAESLRQGLTEIDAAGRRLAEQIKRLDLVAQLAAEDALDHALGTGDQMRDWTVPLAEACRARAAEAERSADLTLDLTPAPLGLEYRALECVVLELLGNALQSSRTGDAVRIIGRSAADEYRLEVCDNGVGLPGEGLPGAGQRQLGQNTPGGFGLAVVQYILQRAGAHLSRERDGGTCRTCLCVHLPLRD